MINMSNLQKAQQLLAEAKKKTSSRGFFDFLFGSSNRTEDAVRCYIRAANLFKMEKQWDAAGKAFYEAANLLYRTEDRHSAAINYVAAGNCYRSTEAVNCFLKAIDIYTEKGNFLMAAKHHEAIAKLYGTTDLEKAIEHYEQAADYYRGEGSTVSANSCLVRVAEYAAQLGRYEKSAIIFQEMAYAAIESSLLRFEAKKYFFKAGLCHICVDVLNGQYAVDNYIKTYPSFGDSRECVLLKLIIENVMETNLDGFTEAVRDYDNIYRLDEWYTRILLRIKKLINEIPDLR
ncbi:alpha-soluble NSF attachment protein-like [Diabrotica undecimpunctata]|uniref:alpha-soluble NSF attachment protein-like n=1 Tax=Diabrotica undecimpunctata TaxID=50387 RepID=UPI003B63B608